MVPEGCIAKVLSLTSPKDTCRLSLVASTFRSAADSDAVWDEFLPPDYKELVAASSSSAVMQQQWSKKQLYFWLSDHPLLIDHGTKSFSVEKMSGKRCYMLAARDLSITWGDTPAYWRWTSLPDSRFGEVAELMNVCWLEIRGKIQVKLLSPNTTYTAYLVFKSTTEAVGFEYQPAEVSVGIKGGGGETKTQTVYLDPSSYNRLRSQIVPRQRSSSFFFNLGSGSGFFNRMQQNHEEGQEQQQDEVEDRCYPKLRAADGWMEIQLGDYSSAAADTDSELEMTLTEVKGGNWKRGLIVQGIEIRPKTPHTN